MLDWMVEHGTVSPNDFLRYEQFKMAEDLPARAKLPREVPLMVDRQLARRSPHPNLKRSDDPTCCANA
jgi:hypothetical protein